MIKNRDSKGNMLSLVTLTIGIIITVFIIGFTFNSFLFRCSQSQFDVDAFALSLAGVINAGDRVGQMNELIESSRELLFLSRDDVMASQEEEFADVAPLCQQLMDEAREGHVLLETERRNQSSLIVTELQDLAQSHNDSQTGIFGIAWLQTNAPKVVRLELGSIRGVQSSVLDLHAIPSLSAGDRQEGLVESGSDLLKGNVHARVPGSSGVVDFNLASLPACVDGTCAPARNANPDVFMSSTSVFDNGKKVPSAIEFLPSAVRVVCSMDAAFGAQQENRASVGMSSVGVASGAVAGGK